MTKSKNYYGKKNLYRPYAKVSWIAKDPEPQFLNITSWRFIHRMTLCCRARYVPCVSVPLGPKVVNCFNFSFSKLN